MTGAPPPGLQEWGLESEWAICGGARGRRVPVSCGETPLQGDGLVLIDPRKCQGYF